ncbi:DNA polymerase theta-like [Saccostrea cucullata]|uniref:DNA polymerase theta-like n=1 Tax=Saccostrea cuccullata TaxID=36930 RepID=UPI002ED1B1BA
MNDDLKGGKEDCTKSMTKLTTTAEIHHVPPNPVEESCSVPQIHNSESCDGTSKEILLNKVEKQRNSKQMKTSSAKRYEISSVASSTNAIEIPALISDLIKTGENVNNEKGNRANSDGKVSSLGVHEPDCLRDPDDTAKTNNKQTPAIKQGSDIKTPLVQKNQINLSSMEHLKIHSSSREMDRMSLNKNPKENKEKVTEDMFCSGDFTDSVVFESQMDVGQVDFQALASVGNFQNLRRIYLLRNQCPCDKDLNLSSSLLLSHDMSCDLLPASNFERCMMSDDESDVSKNESYRDLRIPYLSGQEACFQGSDKKEKDPTQTGYSQLSQDLMLALELSDTFNEESDGTQTKKFSEAGILSKGSIGAGVGYGSLGMSPENPGTGRLRACTEAVLLTHLMQYLYLCLTKENLMSAFHDIEMPAVITLSRMEMNGFGFNDEQCERQKTVMIERLGELETEMYQLVGHQFSLTSTEDLSQLPINGDSSSLGQPTRPNRRAPTGRRGRQKTQFSTSKDVLEKLRPYHPLPGILLEWRRISGALTKVVFALQKEKVYVERLKMYRIFTDVQYFSATGRVSLSEPNLQNVPKDFQISASVPKTTDQQMECASPLGRTRNSVRNQTRVLQMSTDLSFNVSMRHAFIPFPGGVLLAADYSQLELRMIAHLSQDAKLIQILNGDGDVFRETDHEERQQAKQICYGMIYGIGAKALGETLGVDENDAAVFMQTFKSKYPGMRRYLKNTLDKCIKDKFVETISGRRRYLPSISNTNPYVRAHAERQAVNTTVQGSAADLVKVAMNRIDQRLSEIFPLSQKSLSHKDQGPTLDLSGNRCCLVLQLHDELIYDVTETCLRQAAKVIKQEMESAMTLSVKMPVKVKTFGTNILLISGDDHDIATAACIGLSPQRAHTAAIPRKCGGGESCNEICQSVTGMDYAGVSFNKKPQCIDALHIYAKRGPYNTPNTLWLNTWRYGSFSCAATHCGPNFCCCSQ